MLSSNDKIFRWDDASIQYLYLAVLEPTAIACSGTIHTYLGLTFNTTQHMHLMLNVDFDGCTAQAGTSYRIIT